MNAVAAILAIACVVAYWPEPKINKADHEAWKAIANTDIDYLTELHQAQKAGRL